MNMDASFSVDSLSVSDEEFIRLYRQGDGDAAAVLLSRYISFINRCAFRYQGSLDFDDLVQEGCIGFLDAIRTFDLDFHSKFSSYASVCMKNRMLKAVEKSSSKKVCILTDSVPLDDASERSDTSTPEKIFIDKESFSAVLADVSNRLSPLEQKIFFAHFSGRDYQTIADSLHISLKSVDNALQRVRRKLKSIRRI